MATYDDPTVLDDYPRRVAALLATVREAFADPPDNPEEVDVWACLAAEILHPTVFTALGQDHRDRGDADLFDRLGATVAEPCRGLLPPARARDP
jgi:hypothetical protein